MKDRNNAKRCLRPLNARMIVYVLYETSDSEVDEKQNQKNNKTDTQWAEEQRDEFIVDNTFKSTTKSTNTFMKIKREYQECGGIEFSYLNTGFCCCMCNMGYENSFSNR